LSNKAGHHKNVYDIVIITHLPSFYKTNLYNRLCVEKNILVVFVGAASTERNRDFTAADIHFPFHQLNEGSFEQRSLLRSCGRLLRFLSGIRYRKLIVNGWDLPEFWLAALFSVKSCKVVAVESGILESTVTGVKALYKKCFLFLMNGALPSGLPQLQLLQRLGFNKPFCITGGVGIPALHAPAAIPEKNTVRKFIFAGRLAPEKNLVTLLQAFASLPEYTLTVAGTGPQAEMLQEMATGNVQFAGYVPNRNLHALYQEHDVFMLTSSAEPWGLVVEEALQAGIPVIVSDKVGCGKDLVENTGAGIIFRHDGVTHLVEAIRQLTDPQRYNAMAAAAGTINFEKRYRDQVNAYALDWTGK
jgi:glycosyltransferase involved in cell wall biosynthesis